MVVCFLLHGPLSEEMKILGIGSREEDGARTYYLWPPVVRCPAIDAIFHFGRHGLFLYTKSNTNGFEFTTFCELCLDTKMIGNCEKQLNPSHAEYRNIRNADFVSLMMTLFVALMMIVSAIIYINSWISA